MGALEIRDLSMVAGTREWILSVQMEFWRLRWRTWWHVAHSVIRFSELHPQVCFATGYDEPVGFPMRRNSDSANCPW